MSFFSKKESVQNPKAPPSSPSRAERTIPQSPAPRPDVRIRTLASDLASLAATGGSRPEATRFAAPVIAEDAPREPKRNFMSAVLIAILVLFFIGGLAYFVYTIRSRLPDVRPALPVSVATPGGDTSEPTVRTIPSPSAPFTHRSFFKKPADETASLVFPSSARTAAALQTYGQRLTQTIAKTKKNSVFIDVSVMKDDGHSISISEFFAMLNIHFFNTAFLQENFEPDFTFFTVKTDGGVAPGFVLRLKPEKNWLFLKNDMATLEASKDLELLFVNSPGARATQGFGDDSIHNNPTRVLSFDAPGAAFTYGWFRNYLILSTSREGFEKALELLQ